MVFTEVCWGISSVGLLMQWESVRYAEWHGNIVNWNGLVAYEGNLGICQNVRGKQFIESARSINS